MAPISIINEYRKVAPVIARCVGLLGSDQRTALREAVNNFDICLSTSFTLVELYFELPSRLSYLDNPIPCGNSKAKLLSTVNAFDLRSYFIRSANELRHVFYGNSTRKILGTMESLAISEFSELSLSTLGGVLDDISDLLVELDDKLQTTIDELLPRSAYEEMLQPITERIRVQKQVAAQATQLLLSELDKSPEDKRKAKTTATSQRPKRRTAGGPRRSARTAGRKGD